MTRSSASTRSSIERSTLRRLAGWLFLLVLLLAPARAAAVDQLHIVSRWPGDVPEHYFWNGAQWQGWNVIGGKKIISPPALVSYQGSVHLFAVSDDQRLYQAIWNGSAWSGWFDFGGPFASTGAAAVDYFGYLILVVGTTDNRLLLTYFDPGTNQWQNYSEFATGVVGRPAMTMHNGQLQILVRGGDQNYYHQFYNGQIVSPFVNVGGPFATGGAIASFQGQLHLFGPSLNGELFEVTGNQLQQFNNLGAPSGTLLDASATAANFANSVLVVIIRAANNGLYARTLSGGSWSPYTASFGQGVTGAGSTFHTTGGTGPGGPNRPPTLGSVVATRTTHSFGREDSLRFEGLNGRPGVGALQALLTPAIVTLSGAANPIVTAAAALADCCTLLVAEGASDPDGNPVSFQWQAVTGTFYSTGSVGSGGVAYGTKITDLSTYTRNSVFWEAPSIGFPVIHHTLMGGLTNVGAKVVDIPPSGQPLSSDSKFAQLEWDRAIHLELSALAGRRLPANHPQFPGGIAMDILATVTGNSQNVGLQPGATIRIVCGNRADTIRNVAFVPGMTVECPYAADEENHNVTLTAVVTGGGTFISAPDGPGLDRWKSRGCTVGTTESIVVKVTASQCNDQVFAGTDAAETHVVEMGTNAGTFNFDWNTFNQADRIVVTYQGTTLFDSGCVGNSGTEALTYAGNSTSITVQSFPNCNGGTGTAWNFTVHCPQ